MIKTVLTVCSLGQLSVFTFVQNKALPNLFMLNFISQLYH